LKNNQMIKSNGKAVLPEVPKARVPTQAGSLQINGISSEAFSTLSAKRVKELISGASRSRILVVGDVMLDEFIWGSVRRISPEAPVPVVQLERESFMPGGAANVARNLAALKVPTELFSIIGRDLAGKKLKRILSEANVRSEGCVCSDSRSTTVKMRIIAHQQQVVRLDRDSTGDLGNRATSQLLKQLEKNIESADALVVGDYGKGVVTQPLLNALKKICRAQGVWLSVDPKPAHVLDLSGVSLLTPNRKEAFELAGVPDASRCADPLHDEQLMMVAERLLASISPTMLLITLGEHGMLLCQNGKQPIHIPTVAQQVFDVSGAGDTVIATLTAAIAAGGSPIEAAILANHAAGVVVGKIGTAITTPEELLSSIPKSNSGLVPFGHGKRQNAAQSLGLADSSLDLAARNGRKVRFQAICTD
jgi:rfaE bifunctional protein kinase chain/domain